MGKTASEERLSEARRPRRNSNVGIKVRSKSEKELAIKAIQQQDVKQDGALRGWSSFVPHTLLGQIDSAAVDHTGDQPLPTRSFEAATIFADASGFTQLTEKLAKSRDGAELMCRIMNRFIGAIIEIVHSHGGDVVKFAGDAVKCIFEVSADTDLRAATCRATACCLELHQKLHNFVGYEDASGEKIQLSLHIGVGCGTVTILHLGGHHGRWECVIAGDPVHQAVYGEPLAKSGETCLSPEAWAILGDAARGAPIEGGETDDGRHFMLVDTLDVPAAAPHAPFQWPSPSSPPVAELLPMLRRYVPFPVATKLHEGVVRDVDLSEMRQVSVMFINCAGLRLVPSSAGDWADAQAEGQAVIMCVQEEVNHMEGQVNKMLVDDKGTVFLCVFGLPPRPHSDDALRAVRTGMTLAAAMSGREGDEFGAVRACIGVSSGRTFCGVVGVSDGEGKGRDRREFTTMGDCVNVAARLMSLASKPGQKHQVIVDQATSEIAKDPRAYGSSFPGLLLEPLPRTQLKGKAKSVELFAPVGEKPKQQGATTVGKQGRDPEYKLLRGMVAELCAYNQESGTIVLTGGRGSGKQVLVEALETFAAEAGMIVLKGAKPEQAREKSKQQRGSCVGVRSSIAGLPLASMRTSTITAMGNGGGGGGGGGDGGGTRKASTASGRETAATGASMRESTLVGEAPTFAIWQVVIEQALAAATSLGWADAAAFVHEALEAEAARPCVAPEDELLEHAALSDAERRELPRMAWLLNALVPEPTAPGAAAAAAAAPPLLPPPPEEEAAMALDLSYEAQGRLVQAMIVAMLRTLSAKKRLMVLLHLQTGTSRDQAVDLWSWRTAQLIAAESHDSRMRVMLSIVTRPVMLHVREPGAVGFSELDAEIDRIFAALTAFAERTQSHLKLKPLDLRQRNCYLLDVLRERYHFSNERSDGVPLALIDFMSERAAGNPKFIEETLAELFKSGVIELAVDDLGDCGGGMHIDPMDVTIEQLREVPAPAKMKAAVLQQFDSLEPVLQRVLKLVSPLECFSEGMLSTLQLPDHIVPRLTQLFNRATEEGILEHLRDVPDDVVGADPGAKQAWGWLMHSMREFVLASLLQSEREMVMQKMAELREYHAPRVTTRSNAVSIGRWSDYIDDHVFSSRSRSTGGFLPGVAASMSATFKGSKDGISMDSIAEGGGNDAAQVASLQKRLEKERQQRLELEKKIDKAQAGSATKSAACTIL